MKHKNLFLLTFLSIMPCVLHALTLNTQFTYYAFTSTLKVVLFTLAPAAYFAVSRDAGFKEILAKGDRKNVRLSFALGFIVFTFIMAAFFVLRPYIDREMIVTAFAKNGITDGNFPIVFIYVVLINAALEEFFFRGFIFMTLHRMNFKKYAHAHSSLMFAFYHVAILNNAVSPGVFVLFIAGLAAAGLIFNYLVTKCKNISGSLIVHISANMAINIIVSAFYFYT